MPLWLTFVILAAAVVVAIILMRPSVLGRDLSRRVNVAGRALCAVAGACLVVLGILTGLSVGHGLYTPTFATQHLLASYEASPKDDSSKLASVEDARGKVILVYRFGCPDCEGAYDAEKAAVDGRDVLWVSSRSEIGHELCQYYGVEWVPSVLSVSKDGHAVIRDLSADDLSGLDEAFQNVGE